MHAPGTLQTGRRVDVCSALCCGAARRVPGARCACCHLLITHSLTHSLTHPLHLFALQAGPKTLPQLDLPGVKLRLLQLLGPKGSIRLLSLATSGGWVGG